MSDEEVGKEINDFSWNEVTFNLDDKGDLNVTENVKRAWREHGFILVKEMFTTDTVHALDACSKDPVIQKELQPRTDENGYNLKFVLWNNIDNGLFGAVARCDKVVETVSSLLDDEVYHYHSKLVLKDPDGSGGFNWHQDYGYWYKNGCLSPDMATLWMPLDRVDEHNGCLKIIPGSHKLGRIEHKPVNNQVTADPERVKQILKRFGYLYVRMSKGDVLIFHSNILHQSGANFSDRRRWAYLSAYNARSNDPVYKHHHPNYYNLEKIRNQEVATYHNKFGNDYMFWKNWNNRDCQDYTKDEDNVNKK